MTPQQKKLIEPDLLQEEICKDGIDTIEDDATDAEGLENCPVTTEDRQLALPNDPGRYCVPGTGGSTGTPCTPCDPGLGQSNCSDVISPSTENQGPGQTQQPACQGADCEVFEQPPSTENQTQQPACQGADCEVFEQPLNPRLPLPNDPGRYCVPGTGGSTGTPCTPCDPGLGQSNCSDVISDVVSGGLGVFRGEGETPPVITDTAAIQKLESLGTIPAGSTDATNALINSDTPQQLFAAFQKLESLGTIPAGSYQEFTQTHKEEINDVINQYLKTGQAPNFEQPQVSENQGPGQTQQPACQGADCEVFEQPQPPACQGADCTYKWWGTAIGIVAERIYNQIVDGGSPESKAYNACLDNGGEVVPRTPGNTNDKSITWGPGIVGATQGCKAAPA